MFGVWGAAPTTLARLDVVQAKVLSWCCGALLTTSIPALLVEVGETPLRLRRVKLALQYSVKVVGQRPGHPGKALLEDSWEGGEGRRRGWSFVNSVWRGEEGLAVGGVAPVVVWPRVPPWLLPTPEVDFALLELVRERGEEVSPAGLVRERLCSE